MPKEVDNTLWLLRQNCGNHMRNKESEFFRKIEDEMIYRSLKGYTDYRLKVQGIPIKVRRRIFEYYQNRGYLVTCERTLQGEIMVISWK